MAAAAAAADSLPTSGVPGRTYALKPADECCSPAYRSVKRQSHIPFLNAKHAHFCRTQCARHASTSGSRTSWSAPAQKRLWCSSNGASIGGAIGKGSAARAAAVVYGLPHAQQCCSGKLKVAPMVHSWPGRAAPPKHHVAP